MKTQNNKIEVHKIDIKIGEKVISLKPEQAKELKKILNEMFEETKVIHEHHYDHRYWWNLPYYGGPYSPTYSPQWTITCGGTGNFDSGSTYTMTNGGDSTANNVLLSLNAA